MKRPDYLRRLLDMTMGQTIALRPDSDDTVDALFARLKRQATRYRRSLDRSFRFKKESDYVLATRVADGHHRKLSPLLDLALGETIYYADDLTPEEHRRLYAKLTYILDKKRRGLFAERGADGRIYLRCHWRGGDEFWDGVLKPEGKPHPRLNIICNPGGWR